MPIDATARYTNVKARIFTYLAGLDLSGSPIVVFDGDARFNPGQVDRFVRVTIQPISEDWSGRFDASNLAIDARVLVTVDCFERNRADEGDTWNAYTINRTADDVAHAMRDMSLGFLDYSSDPASPTSVASAPIRAIDLPTVERLEDDNGFQWRRVTVEARWVLRHAA